MNTEPQGTTNRYFINNNTFSGDMRDIYGTSLTFELRLSTSSRLEKPTGDEVVFVGSDRDLIHSLDVPTTVWKQSTLAIEVDAGWTVRFHNVTAAHEASIDDILSVLMNVKSFQIKASYNLSQSGSSFLDNVRICWSINLCSAEGHSCSLPFSTSICLQGVCQAQKCVPVSSSEGVNCSASEQCQTNICSQGRCFQTWSTEGTPCEDMDSDLCTSGFCSSGECQVKSKPCPPADDCHIEGTCNPVDGSCTPVKAQNGIECSSFSNLCGLHGTCDSGVCIVDKLKTCVALDLCHDPGVCDERTGKCSTPVKVDFAPCSDNNLCTALDYCLAGQCMSGHDTGCGASLDQCHGEPTCNSTTGECSYEPLSGSTCDDRDPCTTNDRCSSGQCVGTSALTCPSGWRCGLGQCHVFRDLSTLHSPLQTHISSAAQLWWTLRVNSIEQVTISLSSGFVGRPDIGNATNLVLYIRKGGAPTQELYDYRMSGNQMVTIDSILPNEPACGEWVLMLENIGTKNEPFVLSWNTNWSCPLFVKDEGVCQGAARVFALEHNYVGETQFTSNCSGSVSSDQWLVDNACDQFCQLEMRVSSAGCTTGVCRQTVQVSDCVSCEISIDHDPIREGVFIASTSSAFKSIDWSTSCKAELSATTPGAITLALSEFQTCTVSLSLVTSCRKVECSKTLSYTSPSVEKTSSFRFPLNF